MSENSILHDILFLIDKLAIFNAAKSTLHIEFHIFAIRSKFVYRFFYRPYIGNIFECQFSQFTVIEVNGGIILALILYAIWSVGSFMDFKQGAFTVGI